MPGPTGPATRAHRRTRALPRAACNADPPQNQRFLSGLKLWSEGGDDLVTHNQKPGAPEALCCRGIGLGEFLEQLRLLLRPPTAEPCGDPLRRRISSREPAFSKLRRH